MTNLLSIKRLPFINKRKELSLEERAINGDKESFEKLMNQEQEYLYKMAFLYTKNEHDALDIYQDTVYKAFLNIKKLKEPKYFKTWITKILINNFNTKIKKNINHMDIDIYSEKIADVSYEAIEDKIDLYDAIDKLDEKYKTPIILQYFQDMPINEIAKVLECNENTVKTYLRRGRKKLYNIIVEGK